MMKLKLLAACAVALMLAGCDGDAGLTREAINPWEWNAGFGFDQGVVISGATRTLYLAGQVSADPAGVTLHVGDTRGQFGQAFDNLDTMLEGAAMDRSNVARLTIFTTDIPGIIENWDVYMTRYAETGHTPPVTLIGVASLYVPEAVVEIEAIAVD